MTDEPIMWYMSRRVQLPLRAATIAFDEILATAAPAESRARLAGRLTVSPVAALPGVGRRLYGRLAPSGLGAPVPVEFELLPWSDRYVEIGLRPARRPPRARATRYFTAAAGALEELELALYRAAVENAPATVRRAS